MTLSDTDWLALTLFGECRSEPPEGQIAVAAVIRNRVKDGRWGHTFESVVTAPWQFSCWKKEGGAANYEALQFVKRSIELNGIPNDRVLRWCYCLASACVAGDMPNTVAGATHYFVTHSAVPKWAINQVPVKVIGHHSFFAGIK